MNALIQMRLQSIRFDIHYFYCDYTLCNLFMKDSSGKILQITLNPISQLTNNSKTLKNDCSPISAASNIATRVFEVFDEF